jgi:hypothetical protein
MIRATRAAAMPFVCMLLLAVLATLPGVAQAAARAWLDRDRIAFGESATLNIEVDGHPPPPDYGALEADFRLDGHTSSRRFQRVNGRSSERTLYAVMLEPRREGVIGIPSIPVGGERTAPLSLTVTPTAAAPARAGERVFIEVEVDDHAPYVQQAVGVVVRLFYSVPLVSGQLDQDPPQGASLQRVGDDLRFTREIAGRRYEVVERRFLMIPETSGDLVLPGARFSGRGVPGFFDEIFNGGAGDALAARAAPVRMQVQPIPGDAPQPWLPLHDLRLRYAATPQSARAGEAATIAIELVADGAGASQLPELELQVGSGAQVFGEPARADERFRDGRPQATVVRRFSVVPARPGALEIPGPRVQWWDVAEDRMRTTQLPPVVLDVAPGRGGFARQAPPDDVPGSDVADGSVDAREQAWLRVPGIQGEVRPWALATVVFALLWLLTLAWGLFRRRTAPGPVAEPGAHGDARRDAHASLRRALHDGDLHGIEDALRAAAPGPAPDLAAVHRQLDTPAQRDAIEALQRARWGQGDPGAARAALREAFAKGARWAGPADTADEPLPPLYPR